MVHKNKDNAIPNQGYHTYNNEKPIEHQLDIHCTPH